MTRRKVRADCRADTRGGRWAGIPICVIESSAYRDCGVHARAILVELVARLNGWNNGSIAASHRELRDLLHCSQRKVVRGLAELSSGDSPSAGLGGTGYERSISDVCSPLRPGTYVRFGWKADITLIEVDAWTSAQVEAA